MTAATLADLRAGRCLHARDRHPACDESAPLWDLLGDVSLADLRERWTPLGACLLARTDGEGPSVGAVAWLERGLGTAVLSGADLSSADLTPKRGLSRIC